MAGPLLEFPMIPGHLPPHAESMVSARAAHEALRIPMQWLNNAVERRARGVPHYRIGHLVRFRLSELEQWRDRHAAVVAPRLEQANAATVVVSPPPVATDFNGVNWHRREGLAEIFVRRHGSDCRYSARLRSWFVRTDQGWRRDDTLAVFDRVRGLCREAADRARTEQARRWFASATTVAAVERIARLRADAMPAGGERAQ
jgi:hypothetical protein